MTIILPLLRGHSMIGNIWSSSDLVSGAFLSEMVEQKVSSYTENRKNHIEEGQKQILP